ncbi:MAG: AtpZ/AtpI family protein [Gemmatimonadota bacterium]
MSQRPRGPSGEPSDPGPRRSGAPPSDLARQMGELAGYGLTIGLASALFAWLGSLADDRLGTTPLFVLTGAFVGFGAGFYSMYWRLVLRRPGDDPKGAANGEDDRSHGG